MREKILKKHTWLKRTEIYADDTTPRTRMKEKAKEDYYSEEPAEIEDNKTIAVKNKPKPNYGKRK